MNRAVALAKLDVVAAEVAALRAELEKDDGEIDRSPWMTREEYAAYARVSVDTVSKSWLPKGLPHTGAGRLLRIHRDEADAWRKTL